MKINIITQPLFCNYGGILQNYALQVVLKNMGHEVLTINVPVKDIEGKATIRNYIRCGLNMIASWRGNYNYPFFNPHTLALKERELSFHQQEFVKKNITKVDCPVPFDKSLPEKHPADAWIVGSDQVWRPWCSPNIENYFFSFLPNGLKRIAYAVSFGTDKWEIDPKLTPYISELARRFDAISVREASGVQLCHDYLGVDAIHTLDPTMLLEREDYFKLFSSADLSNSQYIAVYILDLSREKSNIVKREGKNHGIKVIQTGKMYSNRFDSVESWIATIAYAERVITDSFHGTVFSIIFGKPVKILQNSLRGNTRLNSLISILNLKLDEDGYYYVDCESREILADKRRESIDFIINALKS